jgi:hypothetical protein
MFYSLHPSLSKRLFSLSGDTFVVGAVGEGSSSTQVDGDEENNDKPYAGAAYVYVRDETNTWTRQAFLKASNADENDWFGNSVSISGDRIVVGAYQEDSNGVEGDNSKEESGAVYVFVRDGNTWSQEGYLKASNPDGADHFGQSVSISEDTIVVGADKEDSGSDDPNDNCAPNAGAAYVFVRDGNTWTQQAYLKASNADQDDLFGASVAISKDTIVVGAYGEDSSATEINGDMDNNDVPGSGAAYVFVRDGNTWTQQAYLKASNADQSDYLNDV